MSVQVHGVCGDEFVFHLRTCVHVYVIVCVSLCVCVCVSEDRWHGMEVKFVP